MIRSLALAVVVASAASAQSPEAGYLSASEAARKTAVSLQSRRYTLSIAAVCAFGPFQIPSWCPELGNPDYPSDFRRVGGRTWEHPGDEEYERRRYREITAAQGDTIEFTLVNEIAWPTGLSPDAAFALVPMEDFRACNEAPIDRRADCFANPKAGSVTAVPASSRATLRFQAAEPGAYAYYDTRHFSGYGVLYVDKKP